MYRTILLAVELQHGTRYGAHAMAARDVAVTIARGTAQTLHILSVYTYHHTSPHKMPTARDIERDNVLKQQIDEFMYQKIEAYSASLKQETFDVNIILRAGKPRDVILQAARNLRADLLMMGRHHHRGVMDVALGGTARQVSRDAPCPVVLVTPKSEVQEESVTPVARTEGVSSP